MADLDTSANAFDAVQKASAYATAQSRGTAAYNALNHAYGPAIAFDPTSAFNAAKAQVATDTIPTQEAQDQANLQTTQLANKATNLTQQQMAAYRGAAMLQSQANPDGSIPPDAYDKVVRPNAALFGIDPDHVDQFSTMLQQPGGTQYLQHVMQTMMGPTKAVGATTYGVDAQGNPVAIIKDQYGNIHQQSMNGTTTVAQQNADTAGDRLDNTVRHQGVTEQQGAQRVGIAGFNAQTQRQNANTGVYRANTTANNTNFGNPNGALPSGGGGGAPGGNTLPAPSTDLIGAGNPPGSKTAAPAMPQLTGKPLANRTSMAQTVSNANTNYQSASSVINQLMTQANGYTVGAGSWGDWMRGSKAADLRANVDALQGQVGSAIVNSMKNSQGQMGFRMTQAEFKQLSNSLGSLDRDQSAGAFKYHLSLVKQTLDKFNSTMNGGFRQQFGTTPETALGQSAPGLPSGWKYLGTGQ